MVIDPIKHRARNQFNRAALTYDLNCSVQNTVCLQAIQVLLNHQKVFDNIADFGCGTGESTNGLMKHLECKRCYAVDFAEKLLTVAKNKLSYIDKIEWIHCDFDQPIKIAKPLDLIFCNMGLQWSSDVVKTLHLWQGYLKHHGLLLFSVPRADNFPELKEAIKPDFLNDKEIADVLKANGYYLITQRFKRFEVQFTHQLEALKALKATGTNYNKTTIHPIQGLKPLKTDHIFINSNVSQLTYEIGIYLVRSDL